MPDTPKPELRGGRWVALKHDGAPVSSRRMLDDDTEEVTVTQRYHELRKGGPRPGLLAMLTAATCDDETCSTTVHALPPDLPALICDLVRAAASHKVSRGQEWTGTRLSGYSRCSGNGDLRAVRDALAAKYDLER